MTDQQPAGTAPDRLPLGADPMGRAWTLDFATGAVVPATDTPTFVDGLNTTLVPQNELTLQRIAQILAEGGWTVTFDPDTPWAVNVTTEIGIIQIHPHQRGRLLRVIRSFAWDPTEEDWATPEERAAGVEAINRASFIVRYATTEAPPVLSAYLDLPVNGGLTRAQLLLMVRSYVQQVQRALDVTDIWEGLL